MTTGTGRADGRHHGGVEPTWECVLTDLRQSTGTGTYHRSDHRQPPRAASHRHRRAGRSPSWTLLASTIRYMPRAAATTRPSTVNSIRPDDRRRPMWIGVTTPSIQAPTVAEPR